MRDSERKHWIRNMQTSVLSLFILSSAAFGGTARADLPDVAVQSIVGTRLAEIKDLKGRNIEIGVSGGVVTLTGEVPSIWAKREALNRAEEAPAVTEVVDRLVVDSDRSDEEIAREAVKSVRTYPFYTLFENIRLDVSEGTVALAGEVTQPSHSTDLERLVSRIHGVNAVRNELEVLPVSFYDDELRIRIARAIYRDPLLRTYALRADPPIHIIVKNGNVRLEGVVLTEVEKAIAGRNARFAATFLNLENNLRVEKSGATSS